MRFDVYGRFLVEVVRESGGWGIYRIDPGRRWRIEDLPIPADTPEDEVARWLEDLLHESAVSGRTIRRVE